MNKKKIRLSTPEMVSDFIKVCTKYDCDINLHYGSKVFDAKSIVMVFSMVNKIIEVQVISSDESVISSFIEDMRKFEV